jgi:cephalosporin hydroxylase
MKDNYLMHLYQNQNSKISDKWEIYLYTYENILSDYSEKEINFLEIGIQNGGSLEIWSKFFSKAKHLVGCDINELCRELIFEDSRIEVIVGDANSLQTYNDVKDKCNNFDIVLDDGSHLSSDIVKTFTHYFPLLNEGGIFIVEDLHCSYWEQFEGGLFDPYSSISFFKRLADIINFEHWNLRRNQSSVLQGFFSKYSCEISNEDLSQIHSVEFINSLCIVRKKTQAKNLLGKRIIVGNSESVTEKIKDKLFILDPYLDQSLNQWSAEHLSPNEMTRNLEEIQDQLHKQLEELRVQNKELQVQNQELQVQNQSLCDHMTKIKNSFSWQITYPIRMLIKLAIKIRSF